MERAIERFAPLAGIAFVVLVLVGFAVEGSPPSIDDPAADVVQSYVDNDAQVIAASALAAVGAALLVLFGAHVSSRLRAAGSTLLASAAFGGAVICAAGVGVDSALRFALADAAGEISPEALQGLFAAWNGFFWPMHLGIALLVAAVSLAAADTKLLPMWLSGLGVLAAVLLVIPVVPVMLVGLAAAGVWLLITSGLMVRQPQPSSA